MTLAAGNASAQLAPNQTNGFGNGGLVAFSYLQNFDCVDQPTMDLDFNGIKAQSDPNEMQTPICQAVTEPTQDPTGGSLDITAHLYVLVPMFGKDTNPKHAMECPDSGRPDELCGVELGNALIGLFGHIPKAWKNQAERQDAVPRPEQSRTWNLHHARFLGRSVRPARRDARHPEPTEGPFVRADAKPQPRR